MSKTMVTLYFAKWCGHCNDFKPEWEKLKNSKIGVEFAEYEEGKDDDKITDANIQGYPTIKINKGGKIEEYNGNRTADDIIFYLKNGKKGGYSGQQPNVNGGEFNQCGGKRNQKSKRVINNNDEKYKIKYLKYKAKYMKLKSL